MNATAANTNTDPRAEDLEDIDDVLTNEVLCSYIDGELNPIEKALVERMIDDHPEAQQRIARLHIITDLLKSAFWKYPDPDMSDLSPGHGLINSGH